METLKEISITLHKEQIVNDVMIRCNALADTHSTEKDHPTLAPYLRQPDGDEYRPIVARAIMEGYARVKKAAQRWVKYGTSDADNRMERILFNVGDVSSTSYYLKMYNLVGSGIDTEEEECDSVTYSDDTAALIPNSTRFRVFNSSNVNLLTANVAYTIALYALSSDGTLTLKRTVSSTEAALDDNSNLKEPTITMSSIYSDDALDGIVAVVSVGGVEVIRKTYYYVDSTNNEKVSNDYLVTLEMPQNFNIGLTKVLTNEMHEFVVNYIMFKFLFPCLAKESVEWKKMADDKLAEMVSTLNARVNSTERKPSWG